MFENTGYSFAFLKLSNRIIGIVVMLMLVILQTACVSFDKRISTESVNKEAMQSLDALFSIHPSYYSKNEEYPPNVALLFDRVEDISAIDSIQITIRNKESLTVKFLAGKKSVGGGTYTTYDGLEFDNAGRMHLPNKYVYAIVAGSIRKMTLYLNDAGDLVITHTTVGGFGFWILIPFTIYTEHMWVFSRIH
ncbi:MAG: hypothetical protein V3V18_15360 [Methylococcales bacterium]